MAGTKQEEKNAKDGGRLKINRAPVLTLWAVIVAERLGYKRDAALTLGKAVAGLDAQSKGKRLGIYEEREKTPEEKKQARKENRVELMGRQVPVVETEQGLRATVKGRPVNPDSVERYLGSKFGETLPDVRKSMEELAGSFKRGELARKAYSLYVDFRPNIPAGVKGWGAKGELDLGRIKSAGK